MGAASRSLRCRSRCGRQGRGLSRGSCWRSWVSASPLPTCVRETASQAEYADTYASLCVAAGIPPLQLSRFMGHAKVATTLAIYTHLFDDDHAETMAARPQRR
jgi:integrase